MHWDAKWYTPNEKRALSNDDVPYSYKKPNYNANPNYHYPEVIGELYNYKYKKHIPRDVIDRILALPHEELREDLEALLYSAMALGGNINKWPQEKQMDEFYIQVCAAMQFLGAIGDPRSLPVLLEFYKQEHDFCDFFLGDFSYDITVTPVVQCFHEQYQVLEDYLKESGIYQLYKMDILQMLSEEIPLIVKDTAPIKRVLGNMLKFILENGEKWEYYNRAVVADTCSACANIHAEEFLPLIKEIYDRNLADKSFAGDYEDICKDMQDKFRTPAKSRIKNIYEYFSNAKTAIKAKADSAMKHFIFKVKLNNVTKPPVWRKISVPSTITFKKFSDAILQAMGWDGGHLWHFCKKSYEPPFIAVPNEDDMEEHIDANETLLCSYFTAVGQKMLYTYDFGDEWHHEIKLEEITDSDEEGCFVVEAKGKCPPEDCGGPWGYEHLKEVLANPKHEEYEDMLEWLGLESGDEWDANEADIEAGEPVGDEEMDWF